MNVRHNGGFKAIELVICTALVGLLTVVAVPNFVRVQTQATVAQAKADLATLKSGLEAYKVDLGKYPWMNSMATARMPVGMASGNGRQPTLEHLTTPVAYLASPAPFMDPFEADAIYSGPTLSTLVPATDEPYIDAYKQYFYNARNSRDTSTWGQSSPQDVDPYWYFLESSGPDQKHNMMYQIMNMMTVDTNVNRARLGLAFYDPTNGTMSRGSIWELGGEPQGYGTSMAFMINAANGSGVGDWERYGE